MLHFGRQSDQRFISWFTLQCRFPLLIKSKCHEKWKGQFLLWSQTRWWALWEKASRSWVCYAKGLQKGKSDGLSPCLISKVCRWNSVFFSILYSLLSNFFMFQRRARCSLQKKETWMSAEIICCMTVALWQWVNGLISCPWIFPALKVTTHTASG